MQHLEVSGAVRHIYIYICAVRHIYIYIYICVIRRLKVKGKELYLNISSREKERTFVSYVVIGTKLLKENCICKVEHFME